MLRSSQDAPPLSPQHAVYQSWLQLQTRRGAAQQYEYPSTLYVHVSDAPRLLPPPADEPEVQVKPRHGILRVMTDGRRLFGLTRVSAMILSFMQQRVCISCRCSCVAP